jgi:uncharacterized protein YbjT (DUF2867 family)
MTTTNICGPILVLGGSGKTGRRVAERLTAQGVPVRIGSRSAAAPFDWVDSTTWGPALDGVTAAYIAFYPDVAMPGAPEIIAAFTEAALAKGVTRLVLLSGRGEEEAQRSEQMLQASGADWTIIRCSWFMQNFSEGFFLDAILSGVIALPVDDIPEPFVDVEDIADVAVEALTRPGHIGQLYELTGPEALPFADAIREIAEASGRHLSLQRVSMDEFSRQQSEAGNPGDIVEFLRYLFGEVLDGRNVDVADGVARALGRSPASFVDYARRTAATGVWEEQDVR